MQLRPRTPLLPRLLTALAVSAALGLAACGSDNDDGEGDGDTTPPTGTPPATTPPATTPPATDTPPGTGTPPATADDAVEVVLSPDDEVPDVVTPAPGASGTGTITVDAATGAASGQVTVAGLTGTATMAHIHRGIAGAAGPVIIGLEGSADGTTWTIPAGFAFEPADLASYERGALYFNVHTEANPAGEIRGQIVPEGVTMFTVRLANVSDDTTLAIDGTDPVETAAVPLSPGAFIVHRESDDPLLQPLSDANAGLEGVAEDGSPGPYVTGDAAIAGATVFDTPVGADAPGPIGPGGAYEFTFGAVPGDKLGFVLMFIASNDWFYTPTDEDNGIDLFAADGTPTSGDVSDQIALWDSGTEVDEVPGGDATTSPNQVRNQPAPNTGPDEGINVGSLASMGKSVALNGQVLMTTIEPAAQ